MASKLFEIKVFRKEREVDGVNPFVTGLDLDNAEVTYNRLNRHLIGAALRAGGTRSDLHEFHLEFREMDGHGKPSGTRRIWVHPVVEEV